MRLLSLNMPIELDIEKWVRKSQFEFFKNFEEPFFGVTVNIDCTEAYKICKSNGYSFFLYYLHKSLQAANQIEEFKYRLKGEKVMVYGDVHASATINRPDGTYGFSYIDYRENFDEFIVVAKKEIDRIRSSTGLVPAISGENVIHYSSLPWLKFTGLSHARSFSFKDSCPKISFGKMDDVKGRKEMPVSIHAHHALMDGIHVGQYVDLFQELLNNPGF